MDQPATFHITDKFKSQFILCSVILADPVAFVTDWRTVRKLYASIRGHNNYCTLGCVGDWFELFYSLNLLVVAYSISLYIYLFIVVWCPSYKCKILVGTNVIDTLDNDKYMPIDKIIKSNVFIKS